MIRKAVIPAAGLGTRFLPVAKSVPKELVPILDKPMLQYVVEEAAEAVVGVGAVAFVLQVVENLVAVTQVVVANPEVADFQTEAAFDCLAVVACSVDTACFALGVVRIVFGNHLVDIGPSFFACLLVSTYPCLP